MPTINEQIRELRDSGMTQVEVADELGMTQSAISKREAKMRVDTAKKHLADSAAEAKDGEGEFTPIDPEPEAEEIMTNEESERDNSGTTERKAETTPDFLCDCGGRDYYSAREYLATYGTGLENHQIALLRDSEKVCSNCGKLH